MSVKIYSQPASYAAILYSRRIKKSTKLRDGVQFHYFSANDFYKKLFSKNFAPPMSRFP